MIDLDQTFTPIGGGPTGLCVQCRMLAFRHTQHCNPACDEWPECAAGRTADHYHLFAVQDWGGTQECWHGENDKLSLADARKLADDMGRADTLSMSGDVEQGEREFGERFYELVSNNVAPGWEGIWVVPCDDPCRFEEVFDPFGTDAWGQPHWTPSRASD
jgi:hypothetical protein